MSFTETLQATLIDIVPIALVIAVFQLLVLRRPVPRLGKGLAGALELR